MAHRRPQGYLSAMALGRFSKRHPAEVAPQPLYSEMLMQRALDIVAWSARQHAGAMPLAMRVRINAAPKDPARNY